MPVVVEEDALVFSVSAKGHAEFLCRFIGGVDVLLVSRPETERFVLLLEVLADLFKSFGWGLRGDVDPAFCLRAGVRFDNI